jgi:hypothetical protein
MQLEIPRSIVSIKQRLHLSGSAHTGAFKPHNKKSGGNNEKEK